jgi:hypothetical protein
MIQSDINSCVGLTQNPTDRFATFDVPPCAIGTFTVLLAGDCRGIARSSIATKGCVSKWTIVALRRSNPQSRCLTMSLSNGATVAATSDSNNT